MSDSRDDRYASANIFDWVQPKCNFKESNFRDDYKAFSKDMVTKNTVRNCLPSNIKSEFDKFPNHYSIAQKCVRVWTLQSVIYPTLTQALYEDNKYQIKKYIALVRGMNKYLVAPTTKEYATYRGSHMSDKQFNAYKTGNIYRAPAFGATSENESVATKFKNKYSIKFKIPKNCWNAAPISHLSVYPHEKETLLPAYTAFKVLSKANKRIEVQVLDNKNADYGVESRFI